VPSRDLAPPSVVILVADGARPDTLAAAIDRGDLPALGRLREEGGLHRVSSVFPSVTGPAYAPFLTGRHPAAAGLPGIRWFDRAGTRTRWPGHARSYVGLDMHEIGRDLDPAAPTLFELEPHHLGALSVIERGLRPGARVAYGPAFVARAAFTHFRGNVAGWLAIDRAVAAEVAARVARERPRFTFCALTGIDKTSHAAGHDAPAVRDAMRIVDATVAHLRADAERDGRWPTMHLWIVSDHGHSPVHTHEDLAGLLRAWGVRTRAHPWTAGPGHHAAVMVSGNAMAHVYLDLALRERPWWPRLRGRWDWLADRLLARESADLLILPIDPQTLEVRHRTRGAATIRMAHGRYTYEPASGDPLALGPLRGLDADAAHAATATSDYPDALVQLAAVAGAARSGDLILSAARGWDLRARWEPIPHVSAHGALHADHMMVPLLMNHAPARPPRRTTDIFASAAHALGVTARGEGLSWLAD
jgi:hypothetical protein